MVKTKNREIVGAFVGMPGAEPAPPPPAIKPKLAPEIEGAPPSFRLSDLDNIDAVLDFPSKLPDFDRRGARSVTNGYKPHHKATVSKVGIAGNMFIFKARGLTPFHSHIEEKVILHCEFYRHVVEIRVQYAIWDRDKFIRYNRAGRRFPKTAVKTLDIMLTIQIPGLPYLTYHVISVKPSALLDKPAVKKRLALEREMLAAVGITHEVVTEEYVTKLEHNNNLRFSEYMCFTEVEDLALLKPVAEMFAIALARTDAKGSNDRVIAMIMKRHPFNGTRDLGYKLLGIACFFNFIRWDHDHKFAPDAEFDKSRMYFTRSRPPNNNQEGERQ